MFYLDNKAIGKYRIANAYDQMECSSLNLSIQAKALKMDNYTFMICMKEPNFYFLSEVNGRLNPHQDLDI